MMLAASREAATRPGELAKARRLAEDAYWGEFEASDMETAVRRHLGYARAGELERQFRRFRSAVREVAERRRSASALDDRSHDLLLDLVAATRELNAKGVTDRRRSTRIMAAARPDRAAVAGLRARSGGPQADPSVLLQTLRRGLPPRRRGRPIGTTPTRPRPS